MGVILIVIPLIFISAIPSMVIIWFTNTYLKNSKVPSKTFTVVSMLLAIHTAYTLKLELEDGLMSLPFQLAVLSSLWTFLLIIALLGYNFIQRK